MNCEQVFAILTRGPFPTGDLSDSEVEIHLVFCPDCQRLAAALQPVEDCFQEAVSPEESRDLPGYRGLLADFSVGDSGNTKLANSRFPVAHRTRFRFSVLRTTKQVLPAIGRPLAILFFGVMLGLAMSDHIRIHDLATKHEGESNRFMLDRQSDLHVGNLLYGGREGAIGPSEDSSEIQVERQQVTTKPPDLSEATFDLQRGFE